MAGPITASLDAQLAKIRSNVGPGKKVYVSSGVSITGVEFGVAYKPKSWFELSGYASKQWGGPGWEAGARAIFTW